MGSVLLELCVLIYILIAILRQWVEIRQIPPRKQSSLCFCRKALVSLLVKIRLGVPQGSDLGFILLQWLHILFFYADYHYLMNPTDFNILHTPWDCLADVKNNIFGFRIRQTKQAICKHLLGVWEIVMGILYYCLQTAINESEC